ncbi:hypothetical protein [Aliarcobacter butzleri]|uniref:hypothetical protein n=1 Tax=Aliarcobacter butzleri TaxID=28197 RepID=UPI001EDC92E5|nr:hypothetical protein [Aliarcobacter butzleri]MCG3651945.1 hypothetical protein [Aliarcobacter butzleri]
MKKTLIVLSIATVFAFANEPQFKGCTETKITTITSIFSCPSGDYEVTYSSFDKNSSAAKVKSLSEKREQETEQKK